MLAYWIITVSSWPMIPVAVASEEAESEDDSEVDGADEEDDAATDDEGVVEETELYTAACKSRSMMDHLLRMSCLHDDEGVYVLLDVEGGGVYTDVEDVVVGVHSGVEVVLVVVGATYT